MPAPNSPMPESGSLSVVVPIYNGAATVDLLVERLTAALRADGRRFEIILVNDGSHDDSWNRIEALAQQSDVVRGIDLMRNYGQHNALLCGIRGGAARVRGDDGRRSSASAGRDFPPAGQGRGRIRRRLRCVGARAARMAQDHRVTRNEIGAQACDGGAFGHRLERVSSVSDGAARRVRRLPEPVFVDRRPAELEHHPASAASRCGTMHATPARRGIACARWCGMGSTC